jgi:hypothetical protein
MNLFLIPRLLAVGSAYASLVTQSVIAILQVLIVLKVFRFRINYRYLFTLLFFVIGVILFNVVSRAIHFENYGIMSHTHAWLLNFTLMIVFSLGLAGGLRLLSIRSVMQILREER